MSFTAPSLPISKHCRIVAQKSAKHKVFYARLEHILLPRVRIKDLIEREITILSNHKLIILFITLYANVW